MTRFTASTRSSSTVDFAREEVWAALTDPELLPRLTPYLQRIDVDGDRWTWRIARVPVLGTSIGTSFTEVMTFEKPTKIDFTHDDSISSEKSGVEGHYRLEEAGSRTKLSIDLAVTVDLPFPGAARRAVQPAMSAVMMFMGRRFAHNLLNHLGGRG